jgi:hypothetical protein
VSRPWSSFLPLVVPDGIDGMQVNDQQQQRGSLQVISHVLCPFLCQILVPSILPDHSEL